MDGFGAAVHAALSVGEMSRYGYGVCQRELHEPRDGDLYGFVVLDHAEHPTRLHEILEGIKQRVVALIPKIFSENLKYDDHVAVPLDEGVRSCDHLRLGEFRVDVKQPNRWFEPREGGIE